MSLNPCCCGRWSQRTLRKTLKSLTTRNVLILVVVEDGLRDSNAHTYIKRFNIVLILVVVEDGLRARHEADQVFLGKKS